MYSYNHTFCLEELAVECINEKHFKNRSAFMNEFLIQWYLGNTAIFVGHLDIDLEAGAELRIVEKVTDSNVDGSSQKTRFTNVGLNRYRFFVQMAGKDRSFFGPRLITALFPPRNPDTLDKTNWDEFYYPLVKHLQTNTLSDKLVNLACTITIDIGIVQRFYVAKNLKLPSSFSDQLKSIAGFTYPRGRIPNTAKHFGQCYEALNSLVDNRLYNPIKGSPARAARIIKRIYGLPISESGISKLISTSHKNMVEEIRRPGNAN